MATFSQLRSEARLMGFQRLIRLPNLLMLALCQLLVYLFLVPAQAKAGQSIAALLVLLVSTFLVAAAGYIINDYYDVKIDSINKPQRVVVGRQITRRKAMLWHLALSLLGVLGGLSLSWKVGLLNLFAVGLLWLYSHLLKRKLLVGNIAIALLTTLAILAVGLRYGALTNLLVGYAAFSFVLSLIREIIKDMEDLKGDATFDCYTLPIAAGIAGSKYVLYGLLFLYALLIGAMVPQAGWMLRTYGLLLIVIPSLYLLLRLYRADRTEDFRQLSLLCKLIMLAGILSMVLV